MSLRVVLPFFLLLISSAQAGILYKCSAESGQITYTNSKGGYRNCQVVSRDSTPSSSSPSSSTSSKPRAVSNQTPADFPRVTSDTQKSRDSDRRHILEQELASEQKNLEEARKGLADQEAARVSADRLSPLRDRVALHTRNLEALQREIAKLK
ncbi:MAG TPA: DUF4124 domain-containing protein [Rhodocyclaceae bacterium]|nr:DUF4124 domain-containing protein [Rhodocyclaceae bacterium]